MRIVRHKCEVCDAETEDRYGEKLWVSIEQPGTSRIVLHNGKGQYKKVFLNSISDFCCLEHFFVHLGEKLHELLAPVDEPCADHEPCAPNAGEKAPERDRLFGGKGGRVLWDEIHGIKTVENCRSLLHRLCCRLQELEERLSDG